MSSEKLTIALAPGAEPQEVVIRHGQAEEIYPPERIYEKGLINAPVLYFISRRQNKPDYFDLSKTLVIVKLAEGEILLQADPTSKFGDQVFGLIHLNPVLREFFLTDQTGGKHIQPNDLAEVFRRNLRFFPNQEEARNLIFQLKNIKITAQGKVERAQDDRGAKRNVFEQSVESNVPVSFTLKMPIFHGSQPIVFTVEIFLEVNGPSVTCQLFAGSLIDLIEKQREEMLAESIKEFESAGVTIIHQ